MHAAEIPWGFQQLTANNPLVSVKPWTHTQARKGFTQGCGGGHPGVVIGCVAGSTLHLRTQHPTGLPRITISRRLL